MGSFNGELTYTATTNTSATLTFSLTNTSPVANGGFITAFVLNNPGGITSIPSFGSTAANFSLLGLTANGINAAPNAQFDFGASISDAFEGGGKPKDGIGVGASNTFTFGLTGNNLLALTANTFLSTLSQGGSAGEGYAALSVRFRGFEDGGSDKVTFTAGGGPGTGTPIPEPASMALLGMGLLGMGLARFKSRAKPTAA